MATNLMTFDPSAQTVTMSSREISELTGKRHPDVVRDLKNLMAELEQDVSRFARIYSDAMNRDQTEYELPKRETLILVSGYSAKMRAAIIDRWQELERGAAPKIATPAELMLGMAQTLVDQERKLVEVDSRVAALEDKMQPDVKTFSERIPAGMDVKSRQIRRMQKKYGLSAKVCEEVFRFRWDWLDTGLLVANPNPRAPNDKACRAYYDTEVNEAFKNFVAKAKKVGANLYQHKACEARFRIPYLENSAE
ncbi:Rha family transcriptional regulator [Paraburkholderia tropica]|uniref:Rha family transcriptional regulator n=1 Tax=Paraburkholderia tropica TaxID=92647 RepID=UPI002AB24DC0|nr:Rha family transcriptional regulator [Paraburkholderia tropica]